MNAYGRAYCLTEATNFLISPLTMGSTNEQQEATPLQAGIDLEREKLKWGEFYNKDLHTDRKCCPVDTANYSNYTQSGSQAIRQEPSSLQATVYLEWAKQKWSDFHQHTLRSKQDYCIVNVCNLLKSTIKNGTETKKKEAKSLQASVFLKWANLDWSDYHKLTLKFQQESCVANVDNFLKCTITDGTEVEKQQAIKLQATVYLEWANQDWSDYHKHTSKPNKVYCLSNLTNFLNCTLKNGTQAEKQKASSLLNIVQHELAQLSL